MSESVIRSKLEQGVQALSLLLTGYQLQLLTDYVMLLDKWNKVYNLTSIRDPEQMVNKHIIDSLSILPYINANTLLDVGSGGGLPGIPIAIAQPDTAVTLLDSNSKKTRFLSQAKAELNLDNLSVIHGRAEQLELPEYEMVTARAFATIGDIINLSGRHCRSGGTLLLMKGIYPEKELAFEGDGFHLEKVIALNVPDCEGERHLVKLVKD